MDTLFSVLQMTTIKIRPEPLALLGQSKGQSMLMHVDSSYTTHVDKCASEFVRESIILAVTVESGVSRRAGAGECAIALLSHYTTYSGLPTFQRRPKGLSLTITSFRRMSHAFILSRSKSLIHNPAKN